MAPRILLVDDDDMVLHALSAMVEFRLKGITIDTAESAEAALGRIRHIDYDAVVSDIKMPGMDGFQLMEEVLKIRSSTPTLLVTGHGDHDMGVKALKAGAYAFIQKPIDRDYFIAWLTRAIELRRLSRAVEEQNQMLERTVQERTAELERTNQELKTALGQQRDKEEALRASEARFRAIVETTPECVKLVAFDGTLLHMSPSGLRMVEAERAEMVVGKSVYELIAPEDREAFRAFNERICRGEKDSLQFDIVGLMGTRRHMETNAAPLRNPDGAIAHLAVTRDVTERRRAEQLETSQKHVLELIAHDASLSRVFEALVRMLEEQSQSGMLASILLLDDDGLHLRYGAAPNLPEAYNRAIDGVAIGPKVGSCGTAAYRKQAVYVTDIANDSLWADYVDLALAHNLRACWSTPMFSSTGRLLGTLAMYYPEVREPNEDDLRLVDVATHIAAIAIERRAAEEALRASEAKLVAELADTKLLQNISAQLASEEKVEGLCEQILEAAVEIMRSDYGSMQMLYPARGAAGELYLPSLTWIHFRGGEVLAVGTGRFSVQLRHGAAHPQASDHTECRTLRVHEWHRRPGGVSAGRHACRAKHAAALAQRKNGGHAVDTLAQATPAIGAPPAPAGHFGTASGGLDRAQAGRGSLTEQSCRTPDACGRVEPFQSRGSGARAAHD